MAQSISVATLIEDYNTLKNMANTISMSLGSGVHNITCIQDSQGVGVNPKSLEPMNYYALTFDIIYNDTESHPFDSRDDEMTWAQNTHNQLRNVFPSYRIEFNEDHDYGHYMMGFTLIHPTLYEFEEEKLKM